MYKKASSALKYIAPALVLIYTGCCIFLYYRFMAWESGSVYESDLPAHISLAVNDRMYYSLISFIIIGLDKAGAMMALPVILGGFAALSVFFAGRLIDEMTGHKWAPGVSLIAALLLNVLMPIYIRGLSDGRYMGMHSSSIWHNSTYLMMKWMGLWTLLIYLRIEKNISEKLTVKSYLYFTLVLTLTTSAKPSFFLAAAPVMLVFLIIDLVKKNAPVLRLLIFASSVIPSFAVMLLQNNSLFEGQNESSGIVLAPGRAMTAHTGYLIPVSVLSIAFPLMILALHFRELFRNRYMLFAWMCAAVGYAQYFLFSEEGARALDGNLSWGYAFTIILVFGTALVQWLGDMKLFACKGDDVTKGADVKSAGTSSVIKKVYLVLCGSVLLLHAYCGLLFFIRLLQGVSYMMWG
ncbi:MAG: hypothetical protein K5871_11290 [Lachnospiraceae bacterium]|nr:hypothetical protein [Lachnospiraceae bacterium]